MKVELLNPFSSRASEIWCALERESRPTYFQSWSWIETWLACLPREAVPRLAVLQTDRPLAAGFFGRRALRRHRVIPSRALFLNATGVDALDELCIEHNTVVGAASLAALVAALPGDWDELFLPALAQHTFEALATATLPAGCRLRVEREVPSYYVELAQVRASGYVPLLGHRTRAQVRKALREAGELTFEVARDTAEALAIYDELVRLHQVHWQAQGQPGAFADPFFEQFHRRLITNRHEHGELQLMRLRRGPQTIGCTYNLVANGHVMFYQSGLAAQANRLIKPGFLCQVFGVEHCATAGHRIYDFLGGDMLYKRSLATGEMRLVWARIQHRRPWFLLEDRARQLRDVLSGAGPREQRARGAL